MIVDGFDVLPEWILHCKFVSKKKEHNGEMTNAVGSSWNDPEFAVRIRRVIQANASKLDADPEVVATLRQVM